MAAITWQGKNMDHALSTLRQLLPHISFKEAGSFYWSPATQTVHYASAEPESDCSTWALLHEAAHAKLTHRNYASDLELLMLEVEAWDEAKRIARHIGIEIDCDHIEDCLDTYREWLHQRSTCPTCGVVSLQEHANLYRCFNCLNDWQVSTSRFCRPYRLSKHGSKKKTPPVSTVTQATFHKNA